MVRDVPLGLGDRTARGLRFLAYVEVVFEGPSLELGCPPARTRLGCVLGGQQALLVGTLGAHTGQGLLCPSSLTMASRDGCMQLPSPSAAVPALSASPLVLTHLQVPLVSFS